MPFPKDDVTPPVTKIYFVSDILSNLYLPGSNLQNMYDVKDKNHIIYLFLKHHKADVVISNMPDLNKLCQ